VILILRVLFSAIIVVMIGVTTWAGRQRNLFDGGGELLRNPWGVATLFDAYLGFLTFYVWVAYKERSMLSRVLWFILIMALGNIAMAAYVLLKTLGLPRDARIEQLLLRTGR
jgi:hypothetical protein